MDTEQAGLPVKKPVRGISPVWLVPLIALLAAGWLGYRAWQDTGPTIRIEFSDASGIREGKTEIRFKDVRVGMVTDISLDQQLERVLVTAEMDPVVQRYLTAGSRFWVVEPTVTLSGVSGLDTLFSGVFIAMDPGENGAPKKHFQGLDEPPGVRSTDIGTPYLLRADQLGSLDIGSPVYFRQIRVGEVTGYSLAPEGESVEVKIFIDAPYNRLVETGSRFWNVSGFGMQLDARGLEARVTSLATLIAGGIEFDSPESGAERQLAEAGQGFTLFADRQSVAEEAFSIRYHYLLKFSGSVRGLEKGAPVEFRGIKVGEVTDIRFNSSGDELIRVLVTIEPQRIDFTMTPSRTELNQKLREGIATGLKAQLKTGNLLTGALYVDLGRHPGEPGEFITSGRYPEIPTTEGQGEQVIRQLNALIDKVNRFPVEQVGDELTASLTSLRQMLARLEKQGFADRLSRTAGNLESASGSIQQSLKTATAALAQLDRTLETVDRSLSPDSELHYQTLKMVEQMSRASAAFRQLVEELNRNPNAILFGREK